MQAKESPFMPHWFPLASYCISIDVIILLPKADFRTNIINIKRYEQRFNWRRKTKCYCINVAKYRIAALTLCCYRIYKILPFSLHILATHFWCVFLVYMLVHLSQVANNGVNCICSNLFPTILSFDASLALILFARLLQKFTWSDIMYAFHEIRLFVFISNTSSSNQNE